MTATPVIKLGFRVPRADAFSLTQSALAPMVASSFAETEAAGHWLFGSDYDTGSPVKFPDLLTNALLTLTGTATVNSNNVSLPVGTNFLTTAIADAAEQTLCLVIQQQPFTSTLGQGAMIAGYDNGTTAGGALYNTDGGTGGGGFWAYTRNNNPVNQRIPDPSVTGNYVFIGLSWAPQLGPIPPTRTVFASGGAVTTQAVTKTAGGAGHNIQLGATQISAEGALIACELIIFNKHLTAGQLAAVYGRSVSRMATRGIVVA